ncbi:MAG: M20/M25/M40 family metallo-hydrolase [Flavobacteriales bacterium]|nr:M20/M25/M40 family metallo-hydrolase [Flavobacteriales bacterium]
MRKALTLLCTCLSIAVNAQDPIIQTIIDAMRIDSMIHYVEELSGEVPIDLGTGPTTILSRHKNNAGNTVAQDYLMHKMEQFGYAPVLEAFSATGNNVLVTKTGTVYPNEFVILCAHYDAMPSGLFNAPAADDDGSGCGALLEAARILRDIPFEYSVIFAFWDEEEQGLVGSAAKAQQMAANDVLVRGAVNMDAIAYDGNGDTQARVHSRPIANSPELANIAMTVRDDYGIDIDLLLTTPGATYSDHASFWTAGYGAILMIEEFGADGNPHYHTPTDLVEFFDVPYFEKMAKLSIGTFATIAVPVDNTTAVPSTPSPFGNTMYAYPNPTETDAIAWLEVSTADRYQVTLVDALGQVVADLHIGPMASGKHAFKLPMSRLAAGTYSVVATATSGATLSTRLVRTP